MLNVGSSVLGSIGVSTTVVAAVGGTSIVMFDQVEKREKGRNRMRNALIYINTEIKEVPVSHNKNDDTPRGEGTTAMRVVTIINNK